MNHEANKIRGGEIVIGKGKFAGNEFVQWLFLLMKSLLLHMML